MLSGGGNLGSIQVGMLTALTERGIVPDVVIGCSVGALNGAGYAMDPTEDGIARLKRHWVQIPDANVMPSSRVPSAVQLLRKSASLHSSDGLRGSIERLVGSEAEFEDTQIPFQCIAVEVRTAMEHWFDQGPITPAVLASAALPAVYPPVRIDGEDYIDGGVVDNVPITRAIELGCRTIYVLHVGPHGRPDIEIKRPLDGLRQAYWVARNSRFARDLANLPPKVEAVVLPPGRRPDLRYDDFSQTEELIEQGRANAAAFLDERDAVEDGPSRTSDLLAPIQRFAMSTRERSMRNAQTAATSPDGAIVTADDQRPAGDTATAPDPVQPVDRSGVASEDVVEHQLQPERS